MVTLLLIFSLFSSAQDESVSPKTQRKLQELKELQELREKSKKQNEEIEKLKNLRNQLLYEADNRNAWYECFEFILQKLEPKTKEKEQ